MRWSASPRASIAPPPLALRKSAQSQRRPPRRFCAAVGVCVAWTLTRRRVAFHAPVEPRVILSNPHGQRGILLRTTPAGPGSRGFSRPLGQSSASFSSRWRSFVFYFFRDPERAIPTDPGAVVSPADGRIVVITDEPNKGTQSIDNPFGTRLSPMS